MHTSIKTKQPHFAIEKERLTNPSQSESAKRKFSQSKEESFAQITKKSAIEEEILRIKKSQVELG